MPPLTKDEIEAFLKEAPIARFCTKNSDGAIHVAPIWFKYDQGEFLFGTQDKSRRVRNLKRNSDVTLLIDNQAPPYKGIVVYGKATLDYDNVINKRVSIFKKYMPEENAKGMADGLAKTWKPVVIHVKPHRMTSYDYAKAPGRK
jgi:nitroimidazol reductase NimA-like FMN-containing flavoprotein (pyridoxamine 5'-phosphate oxidase superfamily)